MDQWWKVIVPSRKETLGVWTKLGVSLFTATPTELISFLAKPTRTPPKWAELDLTLQKLRMYAFVYYFVK